MPGYMTYWPKDHVKKLQKANDAGPLLVVFGSIHSRMPSIASVKPGDIIYPVTMMNNTLCVLGRLPVEKKESAYDYLVRELGNQCSALTPKFDSDGNPLTEEQSYAYYNTPLLPHKPHQQPFNCCSKDAVSGTQGSTIELRPLPIDILPDLRFGWPKSKQKGLLLKEDGGIVVSCLCSTRRLGDETFAIFEALFQEKE